MHEFNLVHHSETDVQLPCDSDGELARGARMRNIILERAKPDDFRNIYDYRTFAEMEFCKYVGQMISRGSSLDTNSMKRIFESVTV